MEIGRSRWNTTHRLSLCFCNKSANHVNSYHIPSSLRFLHPRTGFWNILLHRKKYVLMWCTRSKCSKMRDWSLYDSRVTNISWWNWISNKHNWSPEVGWLYPKWQNHASTKIKYGDSKWLNWPSQSVQIQLEWRRTTLDMELRRYRQKFLIHVRPYIPSVDCSTCI